MAAVVQPNDSNQALEVFPDTQTTGQPQPNPNIPPPPPPKRKGGFKYIFLGFLLVILIGAAIAGFFVYRNNQNQSDYIAEETELDDTEINEVEEEISDESYALNISNESGGFAEFDIVIDPDNLYIRLTSGADNYSNFTAGWYVIPKNIVDSDDYQSLVQSGEFKAGGNLTVIENYLSMIFSEDDLTYSFVENTGSQSSPTDTISFSNLFEVQNDGQAENTGVGPEQQIADRDTQRLIDVTNIADVVARYIEAHNGALPDEDNDLEIEDFPLEPLCIGIAPQCYDLSKAGIELGDTLIPNYIDEMPLDPVYGHVQESGYQIYINENDEIVVEAIYPETKDTIIVTR